MSKVECQVQSLLAKAKAPILDFDVGDSSRSAVQDLRVNPMPAGYQVGSMLSFHGPPCVKMFQLVSSKIGDGSQVLIGDENL